MLAFNPNQVAGLSMAETAGDESISLHDVLGFLRRNLARVLFFLAIGAALGVGYVVSTPPTYTAQARLIIDTSQARIALQDPNVYSLVMESAQVDSEVEIVKSRSVALTVIHQLNLVNEPEYNQPPGLMLRVRRAIKSAFGASAPGSDSAEEDEFRRGMSAYYDRLGVRRLGQSYVLEISYSSVSASRAAEVANAVVDAYIAAKVDAKSNAAQRGADWLEIRLDELGRQSNRAAAEVERFKAVQGIIEADTGGSLAQRQLMDTSSQLLQARSETTKLQARLDAIDAMIATGSVNDYYVADGAGTGISTSLRQRLIEATARQNETIARYGPNGAAAQAAAHDIDLIRSEIRDELYRIRRVYSTDLEAARLNQKTTDGSLKAMVEGTAEKSGQYVRLAELESQASTYRRMYEAMLQQYTQTLQRTSFPVSDARIVTPAVAPFTTSEPKSVLIIALSTVLGAAFGFGLSIFREALGMRIFSPKQVERKTGLPCLGVLPRASSIARLWSRLAFARQSRSRRMSEVLSHPYSRFSAAMGSAKVSLDLCLGQKMPLHIGITSVSTDPERFRLASNLACLYAAEGLRTLLIDSNFMHQGRAGDPPVLIGKTSPLPVSEPDSAGASLARQSAADVPAITTDFSTGVDFAPRSAAVAGQNPHRSVPRLKQRLAQLRESYDVIIVDLPPLSTASDARAAAPHLDAVVISCRYLVTSLKEFVDATASFGPSANRIKGFIIDGAPRTRNHD